MMLRRNPDGSISPDTPVLVNDLLALMEAEARGSVEPTPSRVASAFVDHLELAKGCDYRGPQVISGCSCLNVCFMGKGANGKVSINDCLNCVMGREL